MIKLNNHPLELTHFPAGETGVNVDKLVNWSHANFLELRYENDAELVTLAMAVNAIRSLDIRSAIHLTLPYIPYGRQDRVCNKGEAFSLKVVAGLINSLGFTKVHTYCPHSDVTPALFNNLVIENEYSTKYRWIKEWNITHLVSPDAGALKRVYQDAKAFGLPLIECSKKRDTKTGNLLGCKIHDYDLPEEGNFLIIDDLCDGGGTFVMLAEEFENYYESKTSLYLYVSHGLFTKGLDELHKHFEGIACAYGTEKFK